MAGVPAPRLASAMDTTRAVPRRAVLAGVGAGAGLVVLAACSSSPPTGTGNTDGDGGGGGGSATLAPGQALAPLTDVPVGGSVVVTVDGVPVVVAQPTDGDVRAFSAVCTHERCTVASEGAELACPCHGSRFDAATGDVLRGPARAPLAAISVAVDGAQVVTA